MLSPTTETELADVVAGASGPLSIRGGGTRGVVTEGEPVSTAGLSGIGLYDPGALTMVVAAGTPLATIEAALEGENQRLAFEPMDHRPITGVAGEPTIGGVVAGNISGPRRVQAGACRDFVLGVRFVDGDGTVIRNGGRVMKNVTGYDLVKLMAGSWGALGILTEVSLKVLPRPETEATVRLVGLAPTEAVAAMSAGLGSPFEVTGAAHRMGTTPETVLRLEGFEASVRYRAGRLQDVLARFGEVDILADPVVSRDMWRGIRDLADLTGKGDIWKVSVKPTDGPSILKAAAPEAAVMDWGGGLVWVRVPEGTDLRARLGAFQGHATLVRAGKETRDRLGLFQPEPPALAALSKGLRARFDPRGLFNPGLFDHPVEA